MWKYKDTGNFGFFPWPNIFSVIADIFWGGSPVARCTAPLPGIHPGVSKRVLQDPSTCSTTWLWRVNMLTGVQPHYLESILEFLNKCYRIHQPAPQPDYDEWTCCQVSSTTTWNPSWSFWTSATGSITLLHNLTMTSEYLNHNQPSYLPQIQWPLSYYSIYSWMFCQQDQLNHHRPLE